VSLITLRAS